MIHLLLFVLALLLSCSQLHSFDTTNICAVNRTITFLQPCSLSNIANGMQYSTGVRVALAQYNADGGFGKVHLELMVVDDEYNATRSREVVMQALADNPQIFAVLGAVGTAPAEATIPVTSSLKIPYIGARSGGFHVLRDPFDRYVINVRPSYVDEAAALVELFLALGKTRIAMFYQNDSYGETVVHGVVNALSSHNLYLHSKACHSKTYPDQADLDAQIYAALRYMNSTDKYAPEAIILGTISIPATYFALAARGYWSDIYLAGVSGTGTDTVIANLNAAGGERLIKNIFTSQVAPMTDDLSFPVVVKYHDAMRRFAPTLTPSSTALEGFLVALVTIDALERTRGVFTRESFLDAIYDNGYVNMSGLRCGPFLPVQDQGGCNQCMHQVFLAKATESATFAMVDEVNPFFNFTTCGYKPKKWIYLQFGQSCSFSGAQQFNCMEFRDGLLAAFRQVNDGGGIRETTKLELRWKDDFENNTISWQNNLEFLSDSNVFGLVGTSSEVLTRIIAEASKKKKPMIGSYSGDLELRDPFNSFVLNFRASLRDEIFALIHYCYHVKNIFKISLVQEDSHLGADGRLHLLSALDSKRLKIHSEGVFARDGTNLTDVALGLFENGSPEAVVLIGYSDVLGSVSRTIHSQNMDVVVLAVSTTSITSFSKFVATQGQLNMKNIVVSQCVPLVTNTQSRAVQEYATALANHDHMLLPTSAGLEGYLVGMLLATSLQRVIDTELTPQTLIEAVYDSGNFNLLDIRCGPVVDSLDNSSASGSCNQCMKRVWIMGFGDNGSMHSIDYDFSFGSCMYLASPNVDFQLRGMRLAMVLIATAGNLYVLVIMGMLIHYRHHQLVQASFKFSLVSCVGAMMCFSSVYLLYPVPSDITCALEPWAADLSFVMLFGPLFIKSYHIDRVFNNNRLRKKLISDRQVMADFVAMLLVFMAFLVFWTLASRRKMQEAWTLDGHRFESCVSPIESFQYAAFSMKASMLLWGCFLCQRVYKLDSKFAHFNESKQIVICICCTTLMSIIAMLLRNSVQDPNLYFASFASLLIMNTLVTVTVFFTFPVYYATKRINVISELSTMSNPIAAERNAHLMVHPPKIEAHGVVPHLHNNFFPEAHAKLINN